MKSRLISAAIVAALTLTGVSMYAQEKAEHKFPQPDQSGKIGIAAHRGFWKCEAAGNSQNSIAALKAAQDNKFWGSEFDVQLTKDGVAIVNHDDRIQGMKIIEHDFADFKKCKLANGESIPTLDDYLKQGAKSKKTILVLEIKSQDSKEHEDQLLDLIYASLKSHKLMKPERVMFISFSHYVCQRLAKDCPEFTIQYLNGDLTPETLAAEGINGIDYQYRKVAQHPEYITECKALGMSSNAWTVDKEANIKNMIELGVGTITTNEPLLVRSLLKSKELRKK